MLISSAMNDAINEQIGNEFAASLQYVSVAAYFDNESLPVLARHFYIQANEERDHAMRFVKYVVDAGGQVSIPALAAARAGFNSAADAVQLALDSELKVTRQINGLMDLALSEHDHLTSSMLQWFVTEQLEEVSSMETLLKMIQRAGEAGLLFVESYLQQNGLSAANAAESATP
jgi:bacterioferritin B